jgi:hypothetical protein
MAKDFWQELSKDYGYTFFTGVPFKEAKYLYKSMDASIMHYIPAANELISLMMASGAAVTGNASGVILDSYRIGKLDLSFNIEFSIPVLFITSTSNCALPKGLYNKTELDKVISYIDKHKRPAALVL